jgi:hypothetical protein
MNARSTRKGDARGPSAASLAEIPELDLSRLRRVRNRFASRKAVNVRIIDRDLEPWFPDSEAVNRALRALVAVHLSLGEHARRRPRRPGRAA